MWFLPKDYVWVHTRVENYHKDHKEKASILTEFRIDWEIVSFKATVTTDKWVFNWSSFWTTDKEKAFEKLETVAVWRALAFAWYEIKSWIASSEEMENFEANKTDKIWYNNFEKDKDTMIDKIVDWETTPEKIIKSIEDKGMTINNKVKESILKLNK